MQISFVTLETPIGKLEITANKNSITNIQLSNRPFQQITNNKNISPIIKNTIKQLKNYFKNPQYKFTIAISPHGTPFQQKVWQQLQKIPAGETKTYGELAKILNTSPRAIGNACRANPILLIIPCHRAISKNGIGGFMGKTSGKKISLKKILLENEEKDA